MRVVISRSFMDLIIPASPMVIAGLLLRDHTATVLRAWLVKK